LKWFGLAGSIGSGKSVLVMLLAGLYVPNEGSSFLTINGSNGPTTPSVLGLALSTRNPIWQTAWIVVANMFLGNEAGWPAGFALAEVPRPA